MSRPRPSPPATWPSRRAPATRIRAPLPHFPTSPRAGKMPESPCGRSRAFRPLARSAHGRPERSSAAGGGRDCLEARGGLTGQPRASRRSPAVPAAHPADERAKHPGASRRRPRHFARSAGRGRAKARPRRRRGRAGGIPRSVRGRPRQFARSRSRRAARRDRCGRRGGSDRLEARDGLPGSRWASRRSPAPHAAHVIDERAEHPGASARRPRHFARSRIGRAGRVAEHRPPSPSTGRHGQGGHSGTYGRHVGRE